MPAELTVYCSGGVRKSSDTADKLFWGPAEKDAVRRGAAPRPVHFVDPEAALPAEVDLRALAGRDLYGVKAADAVIVDARQRRGIGIGMEMLASRLYGTPLIIVAPHETHYRAGRVAFRGTSVQEYLHPHLSALGDVVVENFQQAGAALEHLVGTLSATDTQAYLQQAIEAYERSLQADDPELSGRVAQPR